MLYISKFMQYILIASSAVAQVIYMALLQL